MRLLALLTLLLATLPAAAQPWRYINKQGVATYTTNPNDLPPAQKKRALEQLEQKRAEAEVRKALEAEAAAAAAAEAPPSISVESTPDGAPGSVAPESKPPEKKAPTIHDIWQVKVGEAGKNVETLTADLAAARQAADEANRRAIITPSGQHSAQHADAQAKLQSLQQELTTAQGLLDRLQRAEPRK